MSAAMILMLLVVGRGVGGSTHDIAHRGHVTTDLFQRGGGFTIKSEKSCLTYVFCVRPEDIPFSLPPPRW